jgi:putative DNA primase/helicase
MTDLRTIAQALGRHSPTAAGFLCPCPVPGHGKGNGDRNPSLSIWIGDDGELAVNCFSNCTPRDVFEALRARRLIEDRDDWRQRRERPARPAVVTHAARDDATEIEKRAQRAAAIWNEAVDPTGTIVEIYLRQRRALELTPEVAGAALRYHPRCPWTDGATGATIFVPAMVAVMRSIETNELRAIHRTRLSTDGKKIDRRMLGGAAGAAIKLDRNDSVLEGLHVCEGIETGLAARRLGFRPIWAVGSVVGIAKFPVIGGIEALTIFVEHDENRASEKAAEQCAERWLAAGREVIFAEPMFGSDSDANDALRRRLHEPERSSAAA